MNIVLASQSPYRRAQLTQLGVSFRAEKPRVDEEILKRKGPSDLAELTRYLAREKAMSLKSEFPQAIILGSDQLADLEGRRLDKPGSFDRAKEQLLAMSGKTHRLITSLALLSGDVTHVFTDITEIRLRKLSPEMVESYLRQDEPYDCAGSYKIEKAGMSLIAEVRTSDPSAIQGLPLVSLMSGLEKLGVPLETIWSAK